VRKQNCQEGIFHRVNACCQELVWHGCLHTQEVSTTQKQLQFVLINILFRVSIEAGGNAPFIVFDDADIDKAVEGRRRKVF
jgi:hypothetical protein